MDFSEFCVCVCAHVRSCSCFVSADLHGVGVLLHLVVDLGQQDERLRLLEAVTDSNQTHTHTHSSDAVSLCTPAVLRLCTNTQH